MNGSFGFIREKLDIKILILFILRRLTEPVELEDLTELALCDDGISYFDVTACVAELQKSEHLRLDNNRVSLTGKGVRNGEITENSLPFSVRMKAEKATSVVRAAALRNAMVKARHTTKQDGGCTVTLSLSDGIGEIMTLELFAVSEQQAEALEEGFRKNAESIYNALIRKILE